MDISGDCWGIAFPGAYTLKTMESSGCLQGKICLFAVIAFVFIADACAAEWVLRCQWTDPVTNTERVRQLPGDCVLAVPAGGEVRVSAYRGASLLLIRSAGASGKHAGAPSVRLRAGKTPGPFAAPLEVVTPQAVHAVTVTLYVPHGVTTGKTRHGSTKITVAGEYLGLYLDPTRSGVEKVNANPESYAPPLQYWKLEDGFLDFYVSWTVKLGELVQPTEKTGKRHTRYAPVNYMLLDAIDTLRADLEKQGIAPGHLRFLSVFRTPKYNRRIGSGRFSRHPYGDAFDFVIDADGDLRWDDLTGDGKVTREDGLVLVHAIERLQGAKAIPVGGIGIYMFRTGKHNMTMHLDLRGHRARWAFAHDRRGRKREFEWTSRVFAELDRKEKEAREAKRAKK